MANTYIRTRIEMHLDVRLPLAGTPSAHFIIWYVEEGGDPKAERAVSVYVDYTASKTRTQMVTEALSAAATKIAVLGTGGHTVT